MAFRPDRILLAPLLVLAACGDDAAPDDTTADAGADTTVDVGTDVAPDAVADIEGSDAVVDTSGLDAVDAASDPADVADAEGSALLDPVDAPSTLEALSVAGPFGVGFRQAELSYAAPLEDEPRSLRVFVWYPTQATSGATPRYNGLFPARGIFRDAPPAARGDLPVMIYSHGHRGFAETSAFLMEHFASHGWIAIAPEHTGNTTLIERRTTEIYYQRPYDLSATLDWLYDLPADDPLAGKASDFVIASGHSFGGYTMMLTAGGVLDVDYVASECLAGSTWEMCSTWDDAKAAELRSPEMSDERVQAVVIMAGGDSNKFGETGIDAISIPVLQWTGALDNGRTDGDVIWSHLTSEFRVRIEFVHGSHSSFTSVCDFLGASWEDCTDEYTDNDVAKQNVSTYTLAFARAVAGDADARALLDGTHELNADETEFFSTDPE
jgi:predicted dienelactone hydrolase